MSNPLNQPVIDRLEAAVAELMAAHRNLSPVLLGQGFVVVSAHNQAIDFDVDPDTRHVSRPRVGKPHRVMRFTRDEARRVAEAVQDGTGEPFRAVHVLEAIALDMAEVQRLLDALKAVEAREA